MASDPATDGNEGGTAVVSFNLGLAYERLHTAARYARLRDAAARALRAHAWDVDRRLARYGRAATQAGTEMVVPPSLFLDGLPERLDEEVGPRLDADSAEIGSTLVGPRTWSENPDAAADREERRAGLLSYALGAADTLGAVMVGLGSMFSPKDARRAVRDRADALSRSLSRTVALNETVGTLNGAATTAARIVNLQGTKVWGTMGDGRVRPAHRDAGGQEQHIGEPFIVGGESLQYPRDPAGSAWNVAMCRCSVLFSDGIAAHNESALLQQYGHDPAAMVDARVEGLANRIFSEGKAQEKVISRALRDIEKGTSMRLEGFEHRRKKLDGIKEKIFRKARDKGISYDHAAAGIDDLVRYTWASEADGHGAGIEDVLARMREAGIEPVEIDNYWQRGDDYNGINGIFRTEDGYQFEVQFQTDESWAAKNVSHPLFEEARVLDWNDPRKAELFDEVRDIADEAPLPDGIEGVGTFKQHARPGGDLSANKILDEALPDSPPGFVPDVDAVPDEFVALTEARRWTEIRPVYDDAHVDLDGAHFARDLYDRTDLPEMSKMPDDPLDLPPAITYGTGSIQESLTLARAEIDEIHAVPVDLLGTRLYQNVDFPVVAFSEGSNYAYLRTVGGGGQSVLIGVKVYGPHQTFSILHEFGHLFDQSDITGPGGFTFEMWAKANPGILARYRTAAKQMGKNIPADEVAELRQGMAIEKRAAYIAQREIPEDVVKALDDVTDAIYGTEEIRVLQQMYEYPEDYARIVSVPIYETREGVKWEVGRRPEIQNPNPVFLEYVSQPTEVWARAYSQWIATESSTGDALSGLVAERLADETGLYNYHRQWADESFEPIREAMRNLFATLGLVRNA